ncbi:hypothetical protein PIB30_047390 [Stylosanthes scabra]|uniref:Uncharacterized protein n=1 Tax=Stylosanthes scabra TaxID=79078 RepID=A0ABU6ZFG6_9FABA|nr:hypothetical protein [Stylosanthes scabra]
MHTHHALTQDVYMMISSCKTAKEIWDKLSVTYEEDKKHKVYVSRENEDDFSNSFDENKEANICLIANQDEVNDSNYSNSELQNAYDRLLEEFVKLAQENSVIKKKNVELQKENEFLKNENVTLGKVKTNPNNDPCDSCKMHIQEIEMLKSSLAKFNESSKNLDRILSSQKHVNDREGVGYDTNKASTSKNEHKKIRKPIRQPQAQKAHKILNSPPLEYPCLLTNRPRARAPRYLMGKFPLVARPRDLDGEPAPPCFVTSTTKTSRAARWRWRARTAAAELTKMKAILGISLFRALAHPLLKPNSTYMGEEQLKHNKRSLIFSSFLFFVLHV